MAQYPLHFQQASWAAQWPTLQPTYQVGPPPPPPPPSQYQSPAVTASTVPTALPMVSAPMTTYSTMPPPPPPPEPSGGTSLGLLHNHGMVVAKAQPPKTSGPFPDQKVLDKRKNEAMHASLEWTLEYDSTLPSELVKMCTPLLCQLCSVQLNAGNSARSHYIGKQHEKKVRNYLEEWAVKNKTVAPKRISKPNETVHCDVCDVTFSALKAESHYNSRNHNRLANGLEPLKKAYYNPTTGKWQRHPIEVEIVRDVNASDPTPVTMPLASTTVPPPKYYCAICSVSASSQTQLDAHLKGKQHIKMMHRVPMAGQPLPPKSPYFCEICQVNASSQDQLDMHLKGKSHRTKLNRLTNATTSGIPGPIPGEDVSAPKRMNLIDYRDLFTFDSNTMKWKLI